MIKEYKLSCYTLKNPIIRQSGMFDTDIQTKGCDGCESLIMSSIYYQHLYTILKYILYTIIVGFLILYLII